MGDVGHLIAVSLNVRAECAARYFEIAQFQVLKASSSVPCYQRDQKHEIQQEGCFLIKSARQQQQ
jgi:hypothetical protein